jgi:GH43 family beta-xylosidase
VSEDKLPSHAEQVRLQQHLHYQNPVFDRPFPDPFVFRFGSTFYGYCTGLTESGDRAFPVARSRDLIEWETVGGAMEHLDPAPLHYWAPEVTYADGQFYLYYSCGNEEFMEIRVATSRLPDGGFVDRDVRLTSETFAIDPHIFIDGDGERYLFYATDFLSHKHIGTGTVVDRLVDWFRLEGKPMPVTRARFDWQVYDPRRAEKGNVRWHTVEGPSVIKCKGTYFQMFSGGNWKNNSYGVAYAVSQNVLSSEEWEQPIDGLSLLPVLRSSEKVIGPGHNSIVTGPNGRERFCVYHSWINGERVMSIDRLDVVGERIILLGPTTDPQPVPFRSRPFGTGGPTSPHFLLSTTFRLLGAKGELRIGEGGGRFEIKVSPDGLSGSRSGSLACKEDLFAFQKLSIETNNGNIRLRLNEMVWDDISVSELPDPIRVDISCDDVDMLAAELTEGFVDQFEQDIPIESSGWRSVTPLPIQFSIKNRALIVPAARGGDVSAIVYKGSCFAYFETAVNIRSTGVEGDTGYGFALLSPDDRVEVKFEVQWSDRPRLRVIGNEQDVEIILPDSYSPTEYRQFRFVKIDGRMSIDTEGFLLAKIKVSSGPSRIGIAIMDSPVSVEMFRTVRINV